MKESYSVKEINTKEIWDNFAKNFPKTTSGIPRVTFVQSYTWSTLQEEMGNEVVRFGLYNNESLVGIALGVIIDAKRGKYIHFRHGPLLDFSKKESLEYFINFIKSYAKEKNLWFVRLSPLIEKGSREEKMVHSLDQVRNIPINEVEGMDAWIMKLNFENEDDLFNSIKKKTRYEIRKATKECEVVISKDPRLVDTFYEIEMDTVKRNNWKAFSKKFTKREFELFNEDGNADIILVKYQDKYISGGIFIHYGSQSHYHYGASLTEFRHIPAGYLTLWEAIKLSYQKGFSTFNFWGIAPEGAGKNHPWYGLTSFKKKFPGIEQIWMHGVDIPVSPKYYLTNLYERYEHRKKGF